MEDPVHGLASQLLELRGVRVTQNAYFPFLTHIKQLLFLTICDTTVGMWWDANSYVDKYTFKTTKLHET